MQIIRGDDYQSWVYSNDDDLIVVDPWLTRRQVFPKMNWLLNRESTEEAYLLKNNLIDYSNNNTTISRTASSIDGDWTNDNGIMYKNLDYQIRKGFSI